MSVYTILSSLILSIVTFTGCVVQNHSFNPEIAYYPSVHTVENLPSAFPPLTVEEESLEWGKELYLGWQFAHEFDLYRAITCYKRALFLCPGERKIQVEYHIVEAYYLGKKYLEAVEFYELSSLQEVPWTFPALKELLLMLYDAYNETGQCAKAARIQSVLESLDPPLSEQLYEYNAVINADLCALATLPDPKLSPFLNAYLIESKSVSKARTLNALLPGAGYFYIGQPKTGVTSFVINALFVYAAYQFFDRGYVAAGLITSSLEVGWYFGGINGAGIAAQEWNERLYETTGKEFLTRNRLFPVLMFNFVF